MAKIKNMEGLTEQIVEVGETKSNGKLVTKIVVGAIGLATAIGIVLFCKNRKNQVIDAEVINPDEAL